MKHPRVSTGTIRRREMRDPRDGGGYYITELGQRGVLILTAEECAMHNGYDWHFGPGWGPVEHA